LGCSIDPVKNQGLLLLEKVDGVAL
jgi:hypothetical protein